MTTCRWSRVVGLAGVIIVGICGAACKKDAPAPPPPPPEPAVEFVGRCVNETAGTPYQSIFFFPKKGEMFLYLGTKGAARVPVAVTDEGPRKIDFTFRWSEKDELPTTRTGHVTASGNKWQFELDTLKASTCRPVAAPKFYKMLPELGFAAGKWEDPKERFGIVIAADAQAWVLHLKGVDTIIRYRVLETSDDGTIVTSYGKTPGDTDDEFWAVSRMTREGEIIVHELDDVKLHYKLVAAAPTLAK